MTQRIRTQASRFWSTLVGADTLNAYKNALSVTLAILKEGVLLIWLVICLGLVVFDWASAQAIAIGRGARNWYGNLEKNDSSQIAADVKQKLLSASKASVTMTIAQARQQVGLPEKEATPELPASPKELVSPVSPPPMASSSPSPTTDA